jgi:hypothetical protein
MFPRPINNRLHLSIDLSWVLEYLSGRNHDSEMPAAHELTMRLRTIEVVIHMDMAGIDGRMEVGRGWRGAGRIEN